MEGRPQIMKTRHRYIALLGLMGVIALATGDHLSGGLLSALGLFAVIAAVFAVFISRMREATTRLKVEQQLRDDVDRERDVREQQEALNQLKTDFVGMVAHDLRSPLTAIRGYAELLEDIQPAGSESLELVKEITSAATRMTNLVNDVLDVAAIESQQFPFDPIKFDARDLITDAVNELRSSTEIEVRTEIPDVPVEVVADPQSYRRVLTNLMTNALKYADTSCEVSLRADGGEVVVVVTDDGPGIEADDIPRVFERFSRVGKIRKPGTGLGLYICRSLVERHGARIWVNSTFGEGSAFSFTIPTDDAAFQREAA